MSMSLFDIPLLSAFHLPKGRSFVYEVCLVTEFVFADINEGQQ